MGSIFSIFKSTSEINPLLNNQNKDFLSEKLGLIESTKTDISNITERLISLENMGNENIQKLEDKIAKLSYSADLNNDGIVSRHEMELFVVAQLTSRENTIQKLSDELSLEKKKIEMLNDEYSKLRSHHENLLEKIRSKRGNDNNDNKASLDKSFISTDSIDIFIEEMLQDPEVNIGWMIDSIEEKLYKKVMRIALTSIAKMIDTTKINILSHQIDMKITPTNK